MERSAEYKLNALGIPRTYNGFAYMCCILESYSASDEHDLHMRDVLKRVAESFGVTEKTVISNLTLLAKRACESPAFAQRFGWDCPPTLKEFIFSLIVLSEQTA